MLSNSLKINSEVAPLDIRAATIEPADVPATLPKLIPDVTAALYAPANAAPLTPPPSPPPTMVKKMRLWEIFQISVFQGLDKKTISSVFIFRGTVIINAIKYSLNIIR